MGKPKEKKKEKDLFFVDASNGDTVHQSTGVSLTQIALVNLTHTMIHVLIILLIRLLHYCIYLHIYNIELYIHIIKCQN